MNIQSFKRIKRTKDLIANFSDGFVMGWYMALKDSYKFELDIKYTERKKDKVSYYEWTQGPYYRFSEGQIIYDTCEAYACWQTALEKVNLACQITSAKPNMSIEVENEITGKSNYMVLEGFVQFLLFKPDESRTNLVPYVGYKLSQNDFVQFLKTGQL